MLIGVKLIATGFQGWAGGSGDCKSRPETGLFQLCPNINAPHALPWGSAEFIGLGFSVFITIILCERFGAPIMKSTAVVIGLLVGCIIAAATGYFDRSTIDASPAVSFIWVHTFKLSLYGPIVLPLLAVYIVSHAKVSARYPSYVILTRVSRYLQAKRSEISLQRVKFLAWKWMENSLTPESKEVFWQTA